MKEKCIWTMMLASLSLIVSGCFGYSVGTLLPPHIGTVYVETFDNKTHERNIEADIAREIKNHFHWGGNLKVVDSIEEADAVLAGEIIEYQRCPARYSDAGDREVNEYKLVLVVNLKFTDLIRERVLWAENNFTGEAYYVVSGTPAETQTRVRANSETSGLEFAARDLAQNIVDRTVEGW